jgi:hypothetical protein
MAEINTHNITVLFPGGFKPLTGAHMALAQRYAENPEVDRVILLIGETERQGITRDKSIEIFNLLNSNPKIEIEPTAFNSPITAAYEYLFALPPNATGRYAMAASTKGDDYVRAMTFVPNVDKYKKVGDKKLRKIPAGIDAIELPVSSDPLLYANGEPISASSLRVAIVNRDYETFQASYPNIDPAKVKQIWSLLTGIHESLFSKDWWASIIEGSMGEENKHKHDSKIKKLRSFLDSNDGKSFQYDFDKFAKTVVGAKIEESVLKENYINRQELKTIDQAVDKFFEKHNINVNFQDTIKIKKPDGTYDETENPIDTHFFDRLNDPRNEAPIYTDELIDLFKDLSDEYGYQIARQLQNKQPGAIESDYQFDIPIHMPFFVQFNPKTKMIDLIPKTIKKQSDPWVNSDKSQIIYKIESSNKSGNLLTEGGAGGHMNHPYDAHGLTFGDMKEIINRALSGQLDIEGVPVTEKTDGQNIQVTWKNGQIGFARNKGTVINPMTTAELQSKFDNRGPISDAFGGAGEDLQEAFSRIAPDQLNSIFKNGRVFANMEIIYPATKNVIAYETAVLQFHNLVEYDETGNIIETDATGGALVQRVIQEANAHMQKTFKIIPPQQIKIGRLVDFEDQEKSFINEVDQLRNLFKLQDTDLVTEYHKGWWGNIIRTKATELGYEIPSAVLTTLIYRWAFNDKSTSIVNIKKQIVPPADPKAPVTPESTKKLADATAFLNWVVAFDKQDFKSFQKQNMEPFESIFLRLGAVVLKNAENFLAVNPSEAVQSIKRDLAQLIKELQTSNDIKTLDKLTVELGRIQRLGGFEAIVPSEGIVFVYRGNTYKLTGAFAPVNQILGVLKYTR